MIRKIFLLAGIIIISSVSFAQDTLLFVEEASYSIHKNIYDLGYEPIPGLVTGEYLYSMEAKSGGLFEIYKYREESVKGAPTWVGQMNFQAGRSGHYLHGVRLFNDKENIVFAEYQVENEDGITFDGEISRWERYNQSSLPPDRPDYKYYRDENWVVSKIDSTRFTPPALIGALNHEVYGEVLVFGTSGDLIFANYTEGTTGNAESISGLFTYMSGIDHELEYGGVETRTLTPSNWIYITQDKYALFQDDVVHFVDISNLKKPLITGQVKIDLHPNTVMEGLENGVFAGYLFITDGERIYVVDVNDFQVLQTIDPEGIDDHIDFIVDKNNNPDFYESEFNALYIFREKFKKFDNDRFKFQYDIHKYQVSPDSVYGDNVYNKLEVVARATNVGSDDFGYWSRGRIFLRGQRLLQPMMLPKEGDPWGYTLYDIQQVPSKPVEEVKVEIKQTFGDATSEKDYRLVALPGNVNEPLQDIFSGEHGADWQAYWDNGEDQDFLRQFDGSDRFTFKPGNGFWITSTQSLEYDKVFEHVSVVGDGKLETDIPLHEGWNIISNPLAIDVDWWEVHTNNGNQLQPLWTFDGDFSEQTVFESAKTGQAFYFLNDQGLTELTIPFISSDSTSKSKIDPYKIELITLHEDTPTSSSSIMFVDQKVKSQVDVVAPPGAFEEASIRFRSKKSATKRSNSLARVHHVLDPQGQSFEVVLTATPGEMVTIRLNGWDRSLSANAVLIDQNTGQSYDLSSSDGINLIPEKEQTRFLFVMGGEEYLKKEQSQFLPDRVELMPNYPNPFNPATTIRFALPQESKVQLQVFDVIGRKVATLINNEARSAGIHRIRFDASRQASGLYFAVMEIDNQRFLQKMLLIK